MKRTLILMTVVAAMAMSGAGADEAFQTESGTVLAPNPGTKAVGDLGMTEGLNPCGAPDPDLGSTQGIDGHWNAGAVGRAATLTHDALDMDVWFYNDGCGLVNTDADEGAYDMANDADLGSESGTVPETAAWAIVDLTAGANASFTFTIS